MFSLLKKYFLFGFFFFFFFAFTEYLILYSPILILFCKIKVYIYTQNKIYNCTVKFLTPQPSSIEIYIKWRESLLHIVVVQCKNELCREF